MARWNIAAALHKPKVIIRCLDRPHLVINAVLFWSYGNFSICQYLEARSRVKKYWLPLRVSRHCSVLGNGEQSLTVRLLRDHISIGNCTLPSFLCTRHTGDAYSEHESTTAPTHFILFKFSSSFSKSGSGRKRVPVARYLLRAAVHNSLLIPLHALWYHVIKYGR